jgi:Ethanolamine utilization protein EutJ (predicted chaperonin)
MWAASKQHLYGRSFAGISLVGWSGLFRGMAELYKPIQHSTSSPEKTLFVTPLGIAMQQSPKWL